MSRLRGVCGILGEISTLSNKTCFVQETVVTKLQLISTLAEIHIMALEIRKHFNYFFTYGRVSPVSWSNYMQQLQVAFDRLQNGCTSMKFIATDRHRMIIRNLIQQTHSILNTIDSELQQQKLFTT